MKFSVNSSVYSRLYLDALVLLDGCKTIANIANASKEQLLDCSLSLETAEKIQDFFRNN